MLNKIFKKAFNKNIKYKTKAFCKKTKYGFKISFKKINIYKKLAKLISDTISNRIFNYNPYSLDYIS